MDLRILSEHAMAALAREMVMNIRNYKAIFADFGISETDYYEISKNEYFKRVKEHLTLEWNATTSTVERIRLQGAAGMEQILPTVAKRALDATTSMADVIDSAKLMARIAGIGEVKASERPPGERFVITINLGGDTEHYDKSIDITPNEIKMVAKQGD